MTTHADTPARSTRPRTISVLRAAVLALSAAAVPSFAMSVNETIGGWHVADYELTGGPLDRYCRIRSPRADDRYLTLVNRVDEAVAGAFRGAARFDFNFETNLFDDDRVDFEGATLRVPGRAEWSGVAATWRARAQGGGYLRVDLAQPVDRVLPALAQGRTIELAVGDDTHSIALAGSYSAVVAFEKCLTGIVAR